MFEFASEAAKLSKELQTAIRSRDSVTLDEVLKRIRETDAATLVPARELAEGAALLVELQREKTILADIAAASNTKNFAKLEHVLEKATHSSIAADKLQPVSKL